MRRVLLIVPKVNSSFCHECANYGTLFYSFVSYIHWRCYRQCCALSTWVQMQASVVSIFPLHSPPHPCSCGVDLIIFLQHSLFADLSSFLKVLVAIDWGVVQCPETINKCLYVVVPLDPLTHVEWCTKMCIGQTKLNPPPSTPNWGL